LQEAVVNGSLSAAESYPQQQQILSTSALQKENDQLKAKILQLEQAGPVETEPIEDESSVVISKPLFILFVVLLVVFMGFSVYSAFFKREAQPAAVTPQDTTTTTSSEPMRVDTGEQYPTITPENKQKASDSMKRTIDSVRKAEAAVAAQRARERQDSIDNAQADTGVVINSPL
jgi:hypothetical protein